MQTYTFHVVGMHCNACVVLTESELGDLPEVTSVRATLADCSVTVTGEFVATDATGVADNLSRVLEPHGYRLALSRPASGAAWSDFKLAIPFAAGFIALFILLQKLGIVNLITASTVSYGTAFVIGLVASVSTCMAVVGGLVLSLSANFAKEGDTVRPQLLFHVGRLVAFFLLGGFIGALGSAFQLGATATFALSMLVAVVLLILGLNLLDIFPWARKLQLALPSSLGRRVHALKKMNHTLTPLVAGVATFFLPCGFTQSMQLYTLTTGNFLTGGLIMLTFALGTLPILALLSFSSLAIHERARSGVFFKTAGLVVIFFALLNGVSALVAAGILSPFFNL